MRTTLARFSIDQTHVGSAFPNFNEADTLKLLPDGRPIGQANMAKIFKVKIPNGVVRDSVIQALKNLREVLFAEPNGVAAPQIVPNDQYFSYQWSLQAGGGTGRIQAPEAWDIYTGSSNNIIGIIDWGVDGTHPDLSGKVSGDAPSTVYHGTHVAGTAAAKTNNTTGVAGVDWSAQLLSKNIETSDDAGISQKVHDAIDYSSNVKVLNNSWALIQSQYDPAPRYSTTVRTAFAYAYKMNRVAVCANGNYQDLYPGQTYYPAGFGQGIIAVGATDVNDIIWNRSQVNNSIDVSAPGVSILSTYRNGVTFSDPNYEYLSGTSMATPHVSGIASLLKGYNPNLYNDDIEHIIQLSADDITTYPATVGWDQYTGYGRVNAKKALDYLRAPYVLQQRLATGGGNDVGQSGQYWMLILGGYGITDGWYIVKQHSIHKWVSFPYTVNPKVWGRGVGTSGWSAESPNFGMGFSGLVGTNVTNTSALMYTYVYEVWNYLGQWVGWYPTTPQNVMIAYSVLGTNPSPPTVQITGPCCLNKGQGGTWTANVTGGSGNFSYQWYISTCGGCWWNALGTSQAQYYTMGVQDFQLRCDVHDNTLGNNASATFTVYYGLQKQNAAVLLPEKYKLHTAYPNPFNPSTQIKFDLPENATVSFVVYDILGRKVVELVHGYREAGYQSATWNASGVASGIYVARFAATDESGRLKFTKNNKLVLTK